MKLKFSTQREIGLPAEDVEQMIDKYLKKNFYRIVDKGPGYVIFIDDEYSDRKRYRSEVYTRMEEGKFEFKATGKGTFLKLIHLTPVLYPLFLMIAFSAFGMYIGTVWPVVLSFVFAIPVVFKIYSLKYNVFNEILKC